MPALDKFGEWRDLSERLDDMRLEQAQAQGRGM